MCLARGWTPRFGPGESLPFTTEISATRPAILRVGWEMMIGPYDKGVKQYFDLPKSGQDAPIRVTLSP